MAESDFLSIVKERGFVHQCTDETALAAKLREGPLPAYIGYDCTAPSLHVGSLLSIMLLRWWQKCGHKPVVLMGGGTTKVGDPSGKDETRRLLSAEQINENMAGMRRVFEKYLIFGEGPSDAVMADNAEWLDALSYIPFLRGVGRHFSVNTMLTRDSVRLRLDRRQNLSFLEFNYMILQAYDFLELSRRRGCLLQMGGSDQWGNIVGGAELIRRMDGREAFGLTTPLITASSGAKMGKTAEGAVWLNAEMRAPYDYWQFWRNTEDADTGRFLRLFTELPLDEIARLEALGGAEINEAKKILATHATAMAHGEEAAKQAEDTARATFEDGALGADLPVIEITAAELKSGAPAVELLRRAGLAQSNAEARRLIRGGGARLNGEKIEDESAMVTQADAGAEGVMKLSAGKKKHVLVKAVPADGRMTSQISPSSRQHKKARTALAGVDGCKGGWVAFTQNKNGVKAQIFSGFQEALGALGPDAVIVVDMPVGLLKRGEKGGRECERRARSLLKPRRHGAVFSSPVRAALQHPRNYGKAKKANIKSSEARLGLSQQSFALIPKIKEVDDVVTPAEQKRVFEGHPELSFREMAGGRPMQHSKKTAEGVKERLALLKKHGLGGIHDWLDKFPRSQVQPDDILDAAALLWTAQRIAAGKAARIPEQPDYDSKGLDMAMRY